MASLATRRWSTGSVVPRRWPKGSRTRGQAFAETYWAAWVLVLLTLVPALLPRRHEESHLLDEDVPPVAMH